ncbi:MAG: class II aldolase/adducin family protein [Pirellulales bacterium]|nr:class II aldolase/adducin family protein [Pirellulales bacterium]
MTQLDTKIDPTRIVLDTQSHNEQEKDEVIRLANTPLAQAEKVKLAAAYRILARKGLDDGVAGHISMRVPGAPNYFWVNPFGLYFHEVSADNLVLVNHHGEIIQGDFPINYAGFCIHSAIHQARPDVNCACHTHPPAGSAFSALDMLIETIDQTCCSFFEDHAIYREYTGIVISGEQAESIVSAVGNRRALILANHGLLTAASTIEQALIDMLDMERSCEINLKALATCRPLQTAPREVALQARTVLTQDGRWPFQWAALIRWLNKFETDYDPALRKGK